MIYSLFILSFLAGRQIFVIHLERIYFYDSFQFFLILIKQAKNVKSVNCKIILLPIIFIPF
ncbi:hypothetical protein BO219_11960 [Anoxybacillus kestanbolensis]|uniref:Uncharacterized protein n=1 Tax=Anoxybacillus kestanbolensis TaxID=227476 RepID=A0A1V3FHC7_9BACL|nr:hypothetical protein BO219_11960 [Anoxybacillus kestanbolensis]